MSKGQLFPCEQAATLTLPVPRLYERGTRLRQLIPVRALGVPGGLQRQLVRPVVDPSEAAGHPRVQLFVGVLGAEELLGVARVLGLDAVVGQLLLGDGVARSGCRELPVDLLDVVRRAVGRALRTETVICDTRDFGIGRRVNAVNWKALRAVGDNPNQRLCDAQGEHRGRRSQR